MDRTIEITGVVKELKLRAPHSVMMVEVKEADGGTVIYEIEGQAVTGLKRRGITPTSIVTGEVVKVTGHPSRNPNFHGLVGLKLFKLDGAEVPWACGRSC